jgi:hypothetical protein
MTPLRDYKQARAQNFFYCGGEGNDPEAVCNLCFGFKNYVIKILSYV